MLKKSFEKTLLMISNAFRRVKHAFDFEYAEIHLIAIFIKHFFIINTKTFICKNALDLKHKVN